MKPEKREHEPRTDWPGEYEFDFGMCPTCHKTDGYISIEGWEWFYCRTHRVRWCAGLTEAATCRLHTTIPPEKLCSEPERRRAAKPGVALDCRPTRTLPRRLRLQHRRSHVAATPFSVSPRRSWRSMLTSFACE
jgi:hypothetical protein